MIIYQHDSFEVFIKGDHEGLFRFFTNTINKVHPRLIKV